MLTSLLSLIVSSSARIRLVFEPPILLPGAFNSFGVQSAVSFSDAGVFIAETGAVKGVNVSAVLSTDGGQSYRALSFPAGFALPEWPAVHIAGSALRQVP